MAESIKDNGDGQSRSRRSLRIVATVAVVVVVTGALVAWNALSGQDTPQAAAVVGTDTNPELVEPSPPTTTTSTTPPATIEWVDPDAIDLVEASLEPEGPVRVRGRLGVVIEGVHIANPTGPCIVVENSTSVTIRDSRIGPCDGDAISLSSSAAITVENVAVEDATRGIAVKNSRDVVIIESSVMNTNSGIYVLNSTGVAVERNRFIDAGRNFVQFDKVTGPGNSVVDNIGRNALGASNAEDFINIYQSTGTADSPIVVAGNRLRDGGPSPSGSGIMVGDAGGGHIAVTDNLLINPGQAGIGVASGHDIIVSGNVVYSDPVEWSNVGIYVWNQYGSECERITVAGNNVQWLHATTGVNAAWDANTCGEVAGWESNSWGDNPRIEATWWS